MIPCCARASACARPLFVHIGGSLPLILWWLVLVPRCARTAFAHAGVPRAVSWLQVFAPLGMDYGAVCERIKGNGEPGVAWLDNMRAYGRMGDPADFKDWRAMGASSRARARPVCTSRSCVRSRGACVLCVRAVPGCSGGWIGPWLPSCAGGFYSCSSLVLGACACPGPCCCEPGWCDAPMGFARDDAMCAAIAV